MPRWNGNSGGVDWVLTLERDADQKIIGLSARGGGHGHGIGLCQLGAIGMAEGGANYEAILRHYFGASHLAKIY